MESREKTLEVIQKLLRMAKDTSSPNEAAIALKRARKLMDEHNISELEALDNNAQAGFGEEVSERTYRSMPIWQQSLALAVGMLNDTKVSFQYFYHRKSIKFSGFAGDAITASYMYEYLCETVERLSKDIHGKKAKNVFKIGFGEGIRVQVDKLLCERNTIHLSDGRSLVIAKSALVEAKFGKTHSERSKYYVNPNTNSFAKGFEAGKKASLDRQLTKQQLALPA